MISPRKSFEPVPYLVNILIPMVFGVLGGLITISSVKTWYPGIAKPSFNPPNWLFGPVWSALFILIGTAAYLVWRQRHTIVHMPRITAIYFIQLILNLGWSFLFFYTHQIGAALIEIIALLVSIVINGIVFYSVSKPAGLLFIPYFLWVSFAAFLNYNIFILNHV